MASLPLAERPVLYAPAIDYCVITRYRHSEAIFCDDGGYSAAASQLPFSPGTTWRSAKGSTSASARRWASPRPAREPRAPH
jgi:hypothetical protein